MTAETNPSSVAEAARRYQANGMRVIVLHRAVNGFCSCKLGKNCPPKQQGKHPRHNEWVSADPLTEEEIEKFFGGDRPYNLGVVTGPESNLFVVDVDGAEGKATFAKMKDDLPRTQTIRTGSGGLHLYYAYPDFEVGNSARTKLGPGIDTRGKGGYVVAPPSVTGMGAYRQVRSGPPAAMSEFLLEKLRPKEREATAMPAVPVEELDPVEAARLQGYVDGAIEIETNRLRELPVIGWNGPGWDTTTFEVAANLTELANASWNTLTHDTVEALVLEHAPPPDQDGWTVDRVRDKIDSARKKVEGKATPVPAKPEDVGLAFLEAMAGPAEEASTATAAAEPAEAPDVEPIPVHGGVPVIDGAWDPYALERAAAAIDPRSYKASRSLEIPTTEVRAAPVVSDIPSRGPGRPSQALDRWVEESIRSGTPDLFWAAMRTIVAGTEVDAPPIVLRGCSELLVLLTTHLDVRVGPEAGVLLFGPRVTTNDVDDPDAIVLEFADNPMPDRMDMATIAARALASEATLAGYERPEKISHDDPRAAALTRLRDGLPPQKRGAR